MNRTLYRAALCATTICAGTTIWATAAGAQVAEPGASGPAAPAIADPPATATAGTSALPPALDSSDIIVTARKRQESLLKVPVVETAIPAATLQRLQTVDLKNIATLVPGLLVGNQLLSIGTQVSIRGIGTSSSDPGVDQSVALNIDGLQLASGLAYASGMFDTGQVEVLKGPQALFYGKSSPGGVISITTADPTDRFEVIGRAGYEFEAHEQRYEAIVSGPVTETLKLRVGGVYDRQRGFFDNVAEALPGTGAQTPRYAHGPRSRSYILRGTALWNPAPAFSARLKANVTRDDIDNAEAYQFRSCPDGVASPVGIPFIDPRETCKLDRQMRTVDLAPAAFPGIPHGGTPYLLTKQQFGSLELNYRPADDVTLTSVTGYYRLRSRSLVNAIETEYAGGPLAVTNNFHRRDFTEELRLNTTFASPLNFTAGGFYQDGRFANRIDLYGNTALGLPPQIADGLISVGIKTYSGFGQARYKILPDLEIAAGARYTDETRRERAFDYVANASVPPLVPRIHSSNVAPEVTLTYTPTNDLTIFGSYKKGYKSGSFSVAEPLNPALNNSFGDEKVQGGEIGAKGRFLDRSLTMNLAGYYYDYSGLQVGVIEPSPGLVVPIRTVNAASARVYGIDYDIAYRPPSVPNLGLHASANWNHARFSTFNNAPCYGGQTIALGCNQALNPTTGLYTAQDLSGSRLVRAPTWTVNFGFDYELPVGRDMKLILTNNNQYSSRYLTFNSRRADAFQSAFVKTDLALTLQGPRDRWEAAFIGKNLSNRITSSSCVTSNAAAGVVIPGTQTQGGTSSGIAGVDEVGCFVDRGRELVLRLTLRPFS